MKIKQLPDHIRKQLLEKSEQFKKTKYHSNRVEYNGIKFHSKKECNRYKFLKMLEKANKIKELKLQVPFELKVNDVVIERYYADFTYYDKQGNYVVEDTKGFRTTDYKRKKKWVKLIYGIEILES